MAFASLVFALSIFTVLFFYVWSLLCQSRLALLMELIQIFMKMDMNAWK